jgi:hypothetical protein
MPNLNCRIVKVNANYDVRLNEILVSFKVPAAVPVFLRVIHIAHWRVFIVVEVEVAFEWHVPEDEDMGTSQNKPMQEDLELLLDCYFRLVFGDVTTAILILLV